MAILLPQQVALYSSSRRRSVVSLPRSFAFTTPAPCATIAPSAAEVKRAGRTRAEFAWLSAPTVRAVFAPLAPEARRLRALLPRLPSRPSRRCLTALWCRRVSRRCASAHAVVPNARRALPCARAHRGSSSRRTRNQDWKIPRGTVIDTTQFGTSTISLILRSPATLQIAYASCRLRP